MAAATGSTALRRSLDALYAGAAALAGLFMIALLVMVLLSILGRQIGFIAAAAFPFFLLMVAMVLLLWAFPDIATFLPRHMR